MNSVRVWLACVSLCYPFFLASYFVVGAIPSLARVVLFGHKLQSFQISFTYVSGSSAPADSGVVSRPDGRGPQLAMLGAVGAAASVVALLARRYRLVAGLAIAMLGYVGSMPWLRRLLFRPERSVETLGAALACFGLWWMQADGDYRKRAGSLLLRFVLPLAAMWAAFNLLLGTPWSRWPFALLAFGLIASLLASIRRPSVAPAAVGWTTVVVGLAATGVAIAAVHKGGPFLERAREAEVLATLQAAPEIPAGLPYLKVFFQKGVNLTAEWPDVYPSAGAGDMLKLLPEYGVNAVALVPYGFNSIGSTRVSIPTGRGSWESDAGLDYLSRIAHQIGVKVMLKPQVWVGGWSYPGDIDFPSPGDREKWFEQYARFLEHYARLAARIHADLLCVGVELARMTPYESEWRKLIERVRQLYPGPLVYAAGWGADFEQVAFWDALDYIGLNNYYPLPDDLAADGIISKAEAIQRKFERPVIFTEAGFSSYEAPHRKPWDETPRRLSLEDQARCYEAMFQAFYRKPWFQGVYWWKVGTNRAGGAQDGSHTPWGKPAMEVMARWYREGGR